MTGESLYPFHVSTKPYQSSGKEMEKDVDRVDQQLKIEANLLSHWMVVDIHCTKNGINLHSFIEMTVTLKVGPGRCGF